MRIKFIKHGNSWGIRLPKAVLELSRLEPDTELDLSVRPGRIVIRAKAVEDRFDQGYRDFRAVWYQALDDVWLELFGIDG